MNNHQCGLTLGTVLSSGLEAGGMQEIVTHGGMRLTYRDLGERIHRLGSALDALGVQPGSRVAVLDRDTHRYLELYFAVPLLGAALMTANIRLSVEQLRYTLAHSKSALIVAAAEFMPMLEQVYEGAADVPPIVVVGSSESRLKSQGEYEDLLAAADAGFTFPEVDEDAIATHFYTTGTTGLPKGVTYTHRQLVTHTLAVGLALGSADDYQSFRRSDVYMPMTPMFHVHAWGFPYLATLLGIKQVYPGKYDVKGIVDLVQNEGVSFSHCVPTILQMLLTELDERATALPGWKVMIGGSAMSPALASRAMSSGLRVFAAYGMSETCPVISFSRASAERAENHPETVCRAGHAMPLAEIKIESAGDEGQGSEGEVVARAVWLTQGYVDEPSLSKQLWDGGYLHTGDVAVRDEDGALRIVDRIKDIIKTGGEWLSSLDLEASIAEHPDVEEAAVIAIPHPKWGERPCAFVKLRPNATRRSNMITEIQDTLRRHIAQGKLSPYAMLDQIHLVDSLPRTSVGKLDKKLLRQQLPANASGN